MVCLQAAARDESPAAACLRLAENHHVRLFISRDILREVENVLSRDYIRERFKTLTDASVAAFLGRLRETSEYLRTVPKHFDYGGRDVKKEARRVTNAYSRRTRRPRSGPRGTLLLPSAARGTWCHPPPGPRSRQAFNDPTTGGNDDDHHD
jgi:hypothetical protein